MGDINVRYGGKGSRFTELLAVSERILGTITSKGQIYDLDEKKKISIESIMAASTFPRDYDFITEAYTSKIYIMGMSVPPLMIKRVADKLLEHKEKIFKEQR